MEPLRTDDCRVTVRILFVDHSGDLTDMIFCSHGKASDLFGGVTDMVEVLWFRHQFDTAALGHLATFIRATN